MLAPSREAFIVRVLLGTDGEPAGLGFLVGERHIVTCAHVVNEALGRDKYCREPPRATARICVDFPLLGDAEGAPLRRCKVAVWDPPLSIGQSGRDVAGLELVGVDRLPDAANAAQLLCQDALRDAQVSVFGYPGNPSRMLYGGWVTCQLRGSVGGGLVQLDAADGSALRTQLGYSGTPAIVETEWGDAVVGMVTIASRDGSAGDAYAVPIAHLVEVWPEVLAELTLPACPYRGLQAFTEADTAAGIFVGREEEIARLRTMVDERPLALVVGPSGVGKTSLVQAGLTPALRADEWAVVTFRPGSMPFDALARAMLEAEHPDGGYGLDVLAQRAATLRQDGLWPMGARLSLLAGQPMAVVCDQLEDVFAEDVADGDRVAFLDRITAWRTDGLATSRFKLICTMRADFLPALIE
ncbi:MAG: serine protease [Micromonosporaceae bacterium]|nr:serine protease [Micromonosporaceae bacterium]